ncbi:MAG: hypothetical protein EU529_11805 [Promethearchaeota archaeon]|nr:MAG: hypothetical protein EU529_11805 [Candidatus Lokiarchaeota archaeon]
MSEKENNKFYSFKGAPFRGDDIYKVFEGIYKKIQHPDITKNDFLLNRDNIISEILNSLKYNKKNVNKIRYIITVADIMERLLDKSKGQFKSDIIRATHTNAHFLSKIIDFLKKNHDFNEDFRFSTIKLFKNDIIKINSKSYSNLLDYNLQNKLKKYHNYIRKTAKQFKYANIGDRIIPDFYNWLKENYPSEAEKSIQKCYEINSNLEIRKFVIDNIRNTSLSQRKISAYSKRLGIYISKDWISMVALENVFNNDLNKHKERFPQQFSYTMEDLKDLDYDDLNNIEIWLLFKQYYEQKDEYPNLALNFTPKFEKWIREELDTNSEKKFKFISLCDNIMIKNQIQKFIVDKIINTSFSIQKIINLLERMGLSCYYEVITDISLKYFGNNKKLYQKRFPVNEEVPLWLNQKWNVKKFQNIYDLKKFFMNYYRQKRKYPNYGEFTASDFENWIINHKNLTNKRKLELLKKCDEINDNREIYKFVINKIKTTHYNLSEISSFLKFHGLYLSTHSISWISQNIIYKNSIDDYKNRFPTSYDADIGIFGHSALKFILTDFFKSIKIDYFNEIVLFSNRNVRIDGILINHNNLLNKLLHNSDLLNTLSISEKIINKIDFITFDFTSNF